MNRHEIEDQQAETPSVAGRVDRRRILIGAAAAATGLGLVGLASAPSASALTTDVIHDQGGEIFNALAYNGGILNHTTINAAIAAAGAAGGGVVSVPQGTWLISGNIDLSHNGVTLVGAGKAATFLEVQTSYTGDVVTITTKNGCGVRDLTFTAQSSVARTAGSAIRVAGQIGTLPSSTLVQNVDMRYQYNGVVVTDSGSAGAWLVYVDGGDYRDFHPGGVGIWINSAFGGAHYLSNVFMDGSSGPLAFVRVQGSGDFTLTCVSVSGGAQNGLLIDPPTGQSVTAGFITNCEFDTCTNNVVTINAPGGAGSVKQITFANCWMATGSGNNVYIGGSVDRIELVGCKIYNSLGYGVYISGGGATNIFVDSSDISGNVLGGVYVTGSTQHFAVRGSRLGVAYGRAQAFGIKVSAGCNKYIVTGNSTLDSTAGIVDSGGPTKVYSASTNL